MALERRGKWRKNQAQTPPQECRLRLQRMMSTLMLLLRWSGGLSVRRLIYRIYYLQIVLRRKERSARRAKKQARVVDASDIASIVSGNNQTGSLVKSSTEASASKAASSGSGADIQASESERKKKKRARRRKQRKKKAAFGVSSSSAATGMPAEKEEESGQKSLVGIMKYYV
mmetsp:Transcript_30239/g.53168  ORF Transcript_30239/g.53168 Transcript_30239/m.53168 type:complete len:172 (+) Transcript_30239:523-1038(+)